MQKASIVFILLFLLAPPNGFGSAIDCQVSKDRESLQDLAKYLHSSVSKAMRLMKETYGEDVFINTPKELLRSDSKTMGSEFGQFLEVSGYPKASRIGQCSNLLIGIGLDPDAAYILNLPLADQNRLEYLLSKLLELSED